MELTTNDDELVLMFLNTEILSSSSSDEKEAAGIISWFDPGAEAVSRLLSCIFQDVNEAV